MAHAREIRRRIRSIANTAKVTNAMRMVASSKMRKAQEAALAGRPFARLFHRLIASLNGTLEELTHPLLEHRPGGQGPCAVVITTDKGLCGGLNANLLRETIAWPETTRFISVGGKGRQFLARSGRQLIADFPFPDRPTLSDTQPLSDFLIQGFLTHRFDTVSLVYPRFVNTLVSRPVTLQLIPLSEISALPTEGDGAGSLADDPLEAIPQFLFEPSPKAVLDRILPQYVSHLIHQAILSARASEHSARMVAMKSATDNARQLEKDLTLAYNKARQESITNELLEIAAGR